MKRPPTPKHKQVAVKTQEQAYHKCFTSTCDTMIPDIIPGVQAPWFCPDCNRRINEQVRKEERLQQEARTRPWRYRRFQK
jgi:hypothetical protein